MRQDKHAMFKVALLLLEFMATVIAFDRLEDEFRLICHNSGDSTGINMSYSLINIENATYLINITGLPYTQHKVSITYDQNVSECDNREEMQTRNHEFILKPEDDTNCNQGMIWFDQPFFVSGCYKFSIRDDDYDIYKGWLPINNQWKLQDFSFQIPDTQFKFTENGIEHSWDFKNSYFYGKPKLIVQIENTANKTNYDESICSIENSIIRCSIPKFVNGSYIMLEILDDIRCGLLGVQNCRTDGPLIVRPTNPQILVKFVKESESNSLHGVIIGVGIICIIVPVVLASLYLRKWFKNRIWHKRLNKNVCDVDMCRMGNNQKIKGIFLLYARDCDIFMNLMGQFRKKIQNTTKIPVYDMYDIALFNEISRSPHEWIQKHISDPEIKVIVVATRCADVLYKHLLKNCSNQHHDIIPLHSNFYCVPKSLDGYILHAIKLISFDITPAPYHKYFVVKFFNMNEDYLSHINPFKRFELPSNFPYLIQCILEHSLTNKNNSLNDLDMRIEDVINNDADFIKSLESLDQFMKKNPRYLEIDLLSSELFNEEKNVI